MPHAYIHFIGENFYPGTPPERPQPSPLPPHIPIYPGGPVDPGYGQGTPLPPHVGAGGLSWHLESDVAAGDRERRRRALRREQNICAEFHAVMRRIIDARRRIARREIDQPSLQPAIEKHAQTREIPGEAIALRRTPRHFFLHAGFPIFRAVHFGKLHQHAREPFIENGRKSFLLFFDFPLQ